MEAAVLRSSSSMGLQFLLFLPSIATRKWRLDFSLSLSLVVLLCKLRSCVARNPSSSFHARASGTTIDGEAVVAQGVGRGGACYFVAWKRSLDSGAGHPHGTPASTEEKSSSFGIHPLRVRECNQSVVGNFLKPINRNGIDPKMLVST